jgi:hypothetical protein
MMGKRRALLIVLVSAFAIGGISAKDIVVCGTVADVFAKVIPVVDTNRTAVSCSVSVYVGCIATGGDLYFAKTNANGNYSLTVNLPDNCTDNYLFIFKGKKQDRLIATVQVNIPRNSVADTLRQNLQLLTIDETMPDTIPAEVFADWQDQDGTNYASSIASIKANYPAIADKITGSGKEGYKQACHWRRVSRMKPFAADLEHIMFARHHNFGGVVIGYHDNSDSAYCDMSWESKGALCVLTMKNYYSTFKDILRRTDAVVRDPCVSFDGKKVLFAISGKGKGKGYKIYEMEIADTSTLRQLTFDDQGLSDETFTVSDFEPCYLPNGDIMFTSTRNFVLSAQTFNTTTGMFLMNGQGKYMRRVGFDQAHTFYPVLMDDGTVMYSRWEYNDRALISCMGLFVMNPDGSRQTEYFGNQTGWPLTMLQARPIPGSTKVLAVAGGYHGPYAGELMLVDHAKGYNGKQSVSMIAPKRETRPDADTADLGKGGVKSLFQTPCPLDENNFLVSWRKNETDSDYRLYFMNVDGARELLAWAGQSVSQPVLIKPRMEPATPAIQANYGDSVGTFTMQDVYTGDGMQGVARGAAKSLRVIALHYRIAGCGANFGASMGSAPSGAFASAIACPVSAYGASLEAKEVLGEAKIFPDGSAAFKVPARTPVYFQVIDSNGYCIATMRSWSTLMPGETFNCAGCHAAKLLPPPAAIHPAAGAPQALDKPLGVENNRFDFSKMIQPIFDRKCISCHTANHSSGFDLRGDSMSVSSSKKWAKSYNALLKGTGVKSSNDAINICTFFSLPEQQLPYSFGSSLSGIMTKGGMSGGHHEVQVTDVERKTVACWIDLCAPYAGYYNGNMTVADSGNYAKLEQKSEKWAAIEKTNIKEMLAAQTGAMLYGRGNATNTSSGFNPRMTYVPARNAFVLNHADRGNFMLIDLTGRVIYRLEILDRHLAQASIPLPPSLAKGLYVARFVGESLTRQRLVSIIR